MIMADCNSCRKLNNSRCYSNKKCNNHEQYEPKSNADRIRYMSDEEMAKMIQKYVSLDSSEYCKNNSECENILDNGETIPDEKCEKCIVQWLQSEAESEKKLDG